MNNSENKNRRKMTALSEDELMCVNGGIGGRNDIGVGGDYDVMTKRQASFYAEAGGKGALLATMPAKTKLKLTGKSSIVDGKSWVQVTLATGSDGAWVESSMLR